MKTGTPRFVKERLREAMDARGISTLVTISDLLNVHTSTISRWEHGDSTPTPEKLIELANALKVRPSYFLRPLFVHGSNPFFFRSLASARKRDLARQRARLRWAQEVSYIAQHYVKFPALNLPDFLNGASYKSLRDDDLENISKSMREHWKIGDRPITNMIEVCEKNGVVVCCDEMGTSALDGLCNWSEYDYRPYILLANDKMSFFRRQMDAAHELAHAVLHKNATHDELKNNFKLIENQAFRLASAFLMPADNFSLELGVPTLSKLLLLKEKWRVSIKAMIRRCRDLELFDEDYERQLYKYYSAKGWSREEPMDRDVQPAKPKLVYQAIRMVVEAGMRTKQDFLDNDFTIYGHDIEELFGFDEGWFDKGSGVILTLQPNATTASTKGTGVVVPFTPRQRA
ncbi:ImmA/IrrE family metallo-endopeptidase [Aerophototrophica crusticola]|uniref:ImmA/IrrE family metallo-endopeptidase n=1 Tax=Aerophototrophica crusticola TaxID=1709002 RepID=A0A858R7P7_9PROT|nr:ImmA/IrrE family metallo-endopeptidase [Rhodospirillaceae bacterium B3]